MLDFRKGGEEVRRVERKDGSRGGGVSSPTGIRLIAKSGASIVFFGGIVIRGEKTETSSADLSLGRGGKDLKGYTSIT